MGLRRVFVLAAAVAASCFVVPVADAASGARPPVVWLKGEGNFTKAHRSPESIDRIVVHVTEGTFWGSVRWLKSPRAHASSHYVVARSGRIVQLVHLSDIAWHAGNWGTNEQSVGIEHEGFTYGPDGFTDAQYRASARLAAWIARRALMPIDRKHLIGHADVPDGRGGRGGSSHHTDPGPHWNWARYLRLVRTLRGRRAPEREAAPARRPAARHRLLAREGVTGHRPGRVHRRRPRRPRRPAPPVRVRAQHGQAREPRLQAAGARDRRPRPLRRRRGSRPRRQQDLRAHERRRAAVDAGAEHGSGCGCARGARRRRRWCSRSTASGARSTVGPRSSSRGARSGRSPASTCSRWSRPRSTAASPRGGSRWSCRRLRSRSRTPRPKPVPLAVTGMNVAEGQELTGLVVWRVDVRGRAQRVEFLVDGVRAAATSPRPTRSAGTRTPSSRASTRLTARAVGANGKTVEATVTVTVPPPPAGTG